MEGPQLGDLSGPARDWVQAALGSAIIDAQPLHGGWTSAMTLLSSVKGGRFVLRQMTKEPWRTHAAGLLSRESQVQRQLWSTNVPAPASIALDPTGADSGTPSHLMTWLPGSTELIRADHQMLDRLAEALAGIHRIDPDVQRPRRYQSWAGPAKRVVPTWSTVPELWTEAFAVLACEPPDYSDAFIHRDYHPGNVLWEHGEVTGVVDWVETSWGPAELDLAHARTYLAMLHRPQTADAFESAYRNLADRPVSSSLRYWDVMDVVGYLPSPHKVATPWRDQGLQISDIEASTRLEQHLAHVLKR